MNLNSLRVRSLLLASAVYALLLAMALDAQSIYSINAVGYVDFALSAGSNFITNPLSKNDNTVSNLFPSLPDGSFLRIWEPPIGDFGPTNRYETGRGWSNPDRTLVLPQGALLWTPTSAQITFSGELYQGSVTGRTFMSGAYVWGRIPTQGFIICGNINECPPSQPPDGTTFCKWDRVAQRCRNYTYISFPGGGWLDEMFNPVNIDLDPGEAGAFFVPESFSMPLAPNQIPPTLPPGAQITDPRHDGSNLMFQFSAPAGVGFVVLRCMDLTQDNWQTVYEGIGTGAPDTITLPGVTNVSVFYRITAPDDAAMPYLRKELRSGSQFRFQFYAPTGGVYEVQRTLALNPATWQGIRSIPALAKSYLTVTDTNAVASTAYYRLRLNL